MPRLKELKESGTADVGVEKIQGRKPKNEGLSSFKSMTRGQISRKPKE